ncbi:conserved Plasmodium protein, unknown function [Plasmodium chabaudi adami]|uniref:Uncharacterized protein n=1 Tax=Plasmodium chabaudi adami TaxID=5826 RepID=A0A1C6YNI3_PLACE|nr:conserved Plasmodium protein, unknown function [Plasmodium chabaudi adami]
MSETSTCPLNSFFEIDEENDLDELKSKDTDIYRESFLTYIYKQFEFCCTNFFDDFEEKKKNKNNTKRNYLQDYIKKNKVSEFNVFDKIIKRNEDIINEVPLDSKYFSPHADWCECAHELDIELKEKEVEFCIFNFFLKMYRSEPRDKDLILSTILECLDNKKDFKKKYNTMKSKMNFLKEIKSIETSNFKETINELINTIESTNFIQINDNESFYFKLYIIIKIKYQYGIYIFNCDETYDIIVIDFNTYNDNKPKILSFFTLRKFISFLNSIHSIHFNDKNVHDSFPIFFYESKECYTLSHKHLSLKSYIDKIERTKFETSNISNDNESVETYENQDSYESKMQQN